MNLYNYDSIKFQISAHDGRIPENVILWFSPDKVGWYGLWGGKWYGEHISYDEKISFDEMQLILIDRAKATMKELSKKK